MSPGRISWHFSKKKWPRMGASLEARNMAARQKDAETGGSEVIYARPHACASRFSSRINWHFSESKWPRMQASLEARNMAPREKDAEGDVQGQCRCKAECMCVSDVFIHRTEPAGLFTRSVGLMDKASASRAGDSRFESWADQFALRWVD